MKGTQILTDKNHYLTELEVFPAAKIPGAKTLNISENANENFKGFGVAITGASCYNLSLMEDASRYEFLKDIYSFLFHRAKIFLYHTIFQHFVVYLQC